MMTLTLIQMSRVIKQSLEIMSLKSCWTPKPTVAYCILCCRLKNNTLKKWLHNSLSQTPDILTQLPTRYNYLLKSWFVIGNGANIFNLRMIKGAIKKKKKKQLSGPIASVTPWHLLMIRGLGCWPWRSIFSWRSVWAFGDLFWPANIGQCSGGIELLS